MFIIFLKFSKNKDQAGEWMAGHKEWLESGFRDGVFLLAGSLLPGLGGGIVAHRTSLSDLEQRVAADPFIAHNVVTAEIIEMEPSRTDPRLQFLME